jgi:CRISPR-associated protein Cmr2
MTSKIYTVITFAPVQGFIEKSRKLRDLYGSSYLLSYLSWIICHVAKSQGCRVISPALPNVTQGMPNQIIIEGNFSKEDAEAALNIAWKCITEICREWIELQVTGEWRYEPWKRIWRLWTKYSWEFFWVQTPKKESDAASTTNIKTDTISYVRELLNEKKRSRAWTAINWQGESSTLSGTDAIAYPGLGEIHKPDEYNYQKERTAIKKFNAKLSQKLGESFIDATPGLNVSKDNKVERSQEYGESFIDPDEELSVLELIKRLITHKVIVKEIVELLKKRLKERFGEAAIANERFAEIEQLSEDLNPDSFTDLSRPKKKKITDTYQLLQYNDFQGWFQGDGDKAGDYLKRFANTPEEGERINQFSEQMRKWGKHFHKNPPERCRVVYAGGDDFLGVFYDTGKENQRLQPQHCVDCFSTFKSKIWHENEDINQNNPKKKPITVSVGFVWAGSSIPQRDVLQHCRLAEKSAKNKGRDRIAFRVLFNNGNYVEWVCPWWLLEQRLLSSYCDRERNPQKPKQNWTHIYNDVAVLESRHAFNDQTTEIALGLLEVYFPVQIVDIIKDENNWLHDHNADLTVVNAGILGDRKNYTIDSTEIGTLNQTKVNKAINDWIINLAKVGFHLCQQ